MHRCSSTLYCSPSRADEHTDHGKYCKLARLIRTLSRLMMDRASCCRHSSVASFCTEEKVAPNMPTSSLSSRMTSITTHLVVQCVQASRKGEGGAPITKHPRTISTALVSRSKSAVHEYTQCIATHQQKKKVKMAAPSACSQLRSSRSSTERSGETFLPMKPRSTT